MPQSPTHPDELNIEFVTHACLKMSGRFGTLVCDPWILNEPIANFVCWKFPAATIPPEQVIEGCDTVYITHCHEDHFHVPSLDRFPRDMRFLLPEYDTHPGLRAQTMERVLRSLGFYNIRKVRSWETVDLGAGARLTVVPSAASRYYEWENSGFVLEYAGSSILNMNDNISDPELCQAIHERFPNAFDIGFVQSCGTSMYPGCFRMSEEAMREEVRQRQISMADQRRMIDLIRPKAVAPIAGDFAWYEDQYFHNNWTSRATPEVFQDLVRRDYPDRDIEVMVFYPGDTWTPSGGLVRNHPGIDWDNYIDAIRVEAERFRPKVEAMTRWRDDVDLTRLQARSKDFTALVERWITRNDIDFSARFRHRIEGPNSEFDFVLRATPEDGFSISWDDDGPVDQTLYVPERIWAAVLEGKLLWTDLQWNGQAEQHVEFRYDLARMWYWIEYYGALNNKSVQAIIEPRLYPNLIPPIDPTRGVFPMEGEWAAASAKAAPTKKAS